MWKKPHRLDSTLGTPPTHSSACISQRSPTASTLAAWAWAGRTSPARVRSSHTTSWGWPTWSPGAECASWASAGEGSQYCRDSIHIPGMLEEARLCLYSMTKSIIRCARENRYTRKIFRYPVTYNTPYIIFKGSLPKKSLSLSLANFAINCSESVEVE